MKLTKKQKKELVKISIGFIVYFAFCVFAGLWFLVG